MNFTGTSTYTSLHGVEKEMRLAMPLQIAGVAIAALLWLGGGWF
jgi:acetyl-CoA decarbonylase/synthase complex subunit gamma